MSDDKPVVLNDYSGLNSRTSASGKQRHHIEVRCEPLVFDVNTARFTKPVAEAFAQHIRAAIRGITAQASPATVRAREAARKALARGEAWAARRYSGGRMGTRSPGTSDKLFNDSGRFAEGIVAKPAKDGTFRVNVAANRLDPSTLNGSGDVLGRIWQRLVQLVPAINNVAIAMQSDDMLRAQAKAAEKMIKKATSPWGTLKIIAEMGMETAGIVDDLLAG